MPLDPQCLKIVELVRKTRPPISSFTLADIRRPPAVVSEATMALVERVEDRELPGPAGPIPARLYWPNTAGPAGILVFFHGGGFVAGGIPHVDGVCRVLASETGCLVASIGYRLAPEHKFPAGVEDAFAATRWALQEARSLGGVPVAVGGESAGGTLATVACMMARDKGVPLPDYQLLIYPGINLRLSSPERDALAEEDYLLSAEMIDWVNGFYCQREEDFHNPYCAPAYAEDLSGLPPAVIVAGEYDPLRFENEEYAQKLNAAGVATNFRLYAGAIHGFVSAFQHVDIGRRALEECAADLRAALRLNSVD